MSNTTATMAVRRSDTGDLCRGGRFHGVTAALFVVAAMATWPHNAPAAVTVPAANYSIPGVHGSQPRTFHHDFSNDDHQLIYSGVASGGIKPQADLQGSFTIHNLRPPSYNFPLVHSVVQYF